MQAAPRDGTPPTTPAHSMRALTGDLLLEAWERCVPVHDLRRALTILEIALPGATSEQLGALPLAEFNLLLLRLHELTFGSWLDVFGTCPGCGAEFEFAVLAADVAAGMGGHDLAGPMVWQEDGNEYRLRAATADDLLATLTVPDASAAQDVLLARCLQAASAEPGQHAAPAGVLKRFDELNAGSEFACRVDCPDCSSHELLDLDIARFVWAEVRGAARRLLGEIHLLASAYGWSEQAIARMGAGRRAAYLEMLAG